MLGLLIKVGLAVAALGIGIWLGLPGRYTQTADDIERIMEQGGGRRRKVKRVFTPLAWIQRQASARSSRRQGRGRGSSRFRMEAPEDR